MIEPAVEPGRSGAAGAVAVAGAAVCWALIGLFTRRLGARGVGPSDVAFWRAAGGGACFAAQALVGSWVGRGPTGALVGGGRVGGAPDRARDAWRPLVAFSVIGVSVFYLALPSSIAAGGIAVAYVLLYTAPAWVLAGIAVARRRVEAGAVALTLVTMAGAALVVSGTSPRGVTSARGVVWGLVAGVSYSSYYLVGRSLFARLGPTTTFAVALPLGSILLVPFTRFARLDSTSIALLVGLIVVSTWLPYTLLANGLRVVPPERAVVIATLEPVVAAALAWTVYGEGLAWTGVVGAVAVLAASVVAGARRGSPRDDGLRS